MTRSAKPATPTISVVIPTHQRRDVLVAAVDATLAEPGLGEVVVVVDGSTDGTLEWLQGRRETDRRLRVMEGPGRGVTAARQAGADEVTGDVVLFLDDDVVPRPGLIAGHARHHAAKSHVVVLGYMPNDWRTLHPERRAVGLLYRRAYERACELYEADPGNILLKFWAGNCSFARQDLERVSFENPGGRHEDRELGLRCARAGLTGVFDRSLAADHRYDRDLAAFRRDSYRSGVYRGVIEDLHTSAQSAVDPAEVGSGLPFPAPGENLPRWLRAVWPILAAGGVSRIVATVLVALFDAAVRLGDIRVQTVIARALGSVEIHRGMRDHAAHAARTGSPRSVLPSL